MTAAPHPTVRPHPRPPDGGVTGGTERVRCSHHPAAREDRTIPLRHRSHPPAGRVARAAAILLALAAVATFAAACSHPVATLRDDSGSTLALHIDDQFVVTLRANPSAGYTWERLPDASGDTAGVLAPVGQPQFTPDSDMPRAPGEMRFEFRAARVGQTILRLVYRAPGSADVQRTFEVHVTVG